MIRYYLPALLLLAGCATASARTENQTEDPKLTKALAGRAVGAPRRCLPVMDTRDSQVFSGAIVYRAGRATYYRNDMNQCPFLDDDRIPVFQVFGSQVCENDIVTFVDRTSRMQMGSCTVGKFVPYTRPKAG